MAASEAALKIRTAIDTLKTSGVRERPLVEVLGLSHQMADAMQAFFGSLDRSIIGEFQYIADYIQKARDEISGLQPNDIGHTRIPDASQQLDAVVRDTERATETIMSEAEMVMNREPTDLASYKAEVDAAMLRMFEACSFQDLTGQRIRKVISTLRHIEDRVSRFAGALGVKDGVAVETAEEKRNREQILNGPAMNGPATSQDDIDALFS
jgi:chemotaxis protein CheZ